MKNLFLAVVIVSLLSACGSSAGANQSFFKDGISVYIQNNYPLSDVVSSATDTSNYSEVYLAESKTISDVARELQEYETPVKVSEEKEDKQVLVYNDLFVILTLDQENGNPTLIEVADKEFVRNNYSPGFFEGMLLMSFLDNVLDVNDWGKKRSARCKQYPNECYGGYSSSGGSFKGYQQTPSVRGGTSTVRGGGPGAGK